MSTVEMQAGAPIDLGLQPQKFAGSARSYALAAKQREEYEREQAELTSCNHNCPCHSNKVLANRAGFLGARMVMIGLCALTCGILFVLAIMVTLVGWSLFS